MIISRNVTRAYTLCTCLIALWVGARSTTNFAQEHPHGQNNQQVPLEQYLRNQSIQVNPKCAKQPILVFLIKFINFGCVSCLNDFFDLCDSINSRIKQDGKRNVMVCFARDERPEQEQFRTMKGWTRSSGLRFPVVLVPKKIFDDNFIDFSTVILLNKDNEVELMEQFPLSATAISEIIDKLFCKKR